MKIDVHGSLEAVGPDAWDALHAGSRLRSPFLGWTWQHEWVAVFGEGRRLELRRVVDGTGRLVALLPLVEAAPDRWLLAGGSDVSDYLDLLALRDREEEAWAALLGTRASDRAVWELHAVPAASPTVTVMPALAAAVGLTVQAPVEERCPVLDLPDCWDALLASLSGKHRHELTRKLRRFEREAPDGRVAWASTPAAIEARLDDFLGLHRRSREGKAKFMDARMERFFRRAIPALAARGGARLAFLDLPAGPVASFVTLEWEGTVGLYNSGFQPERAALSPGLVLLAHVVRDAIERGRRRFDFLRGEERYKYEFGPTAEAVHAVTIAGRA
ncbi:MAG TPA: GNAT family N-acetyltransferase [Methylomirabilota bacterium]|nr:GNAT family N-acetyltransferase [Methylomirabilota bacterium]